MKKIFANYLEHLKRTMEDRQQRGKKATLDEILADYADRAGLNSLEKRALRRQHFIKIAIDFTQMDAKKDRELVDKGLAPPSVLPGIQPGSKKEKKLKRKTDRNRAWEEPESSHVDKASEDGTDNDDSMNLMTGNSVNRAVFGLIPIEDLRKKVRTLQMRLLEEFMTPGGTINQPQWDSSKDWKERLDLESKINQTLVDLDEARIIEVGKKEDASPTGRAKQNNVKFLAEFDKAIRAENREEREEVVRRLSPEGIQHAYDTALDKFRGDILYKETQGNGEQGDYVRCAVCDWINPDNPSLLPVSHLAKHTEELDATNRGALISSYYDQYPEGALQSREQELAASIEEAVKSVLNTRLTEVSNVATDREKDLYYSDGVLFDLVLHNLRRLKVSPSDINHQEFAAQIVDSIKQDLESEYPDRYDAGSEVGSLGDRNIPWDDFHQIVSTTINDAAREYDGLIVRRRAPRREKVRPLVEEQISKTQYDSPTEEEIQEEGLIPVKLSVEDLSCWNCGENSTIYVKSDLKSVNSTMCPNCGVYRETPVNWKCPTCAEEKQLVIRDPNEKPEASKLYTVYCDEIQIGNGEQAIGNSKYVFVLGSTQRQQQTRRDDKPTSSETFESPIATSDSVSSEQYGIGKVVYIGSGNQLFVDFPENPRVIRLDQAEGEVIYLQTSRPGYLGYYLVEDIQHGPTKLTVKMRGEAGQIFTRDFALDDASLDTPVATEIDQKHVAKANLAVQRKRRQALMMRVGGEGCAGQEVIEIKRHDKPAPTRGELLESRVRRARLIHRVQRS